MHYKKNLMDQTGELVEIEPQFLNSSQLNWSTRKSQAKVKKAVVTNLHIFG